MGGDGEGWGQTGGDDDGYACENAESKYSFYVNQDHITWRHEMKPLAYRQFPAGKIDYTEIKMLSNAVFRVKIGWVAAIRQAYIGEICFHHWNYKAPPLFILTDHKIT